MTTHDNTVPQSSHVEESKQIDAAYDRMARFDVAMQLSHLRSRRRRFYSLSSVLTTLLILEGCTQLGWSM